MKKGKKKYLKKKRSSIYFILWSVFALFSLLIVILLGIAQNLTFQKVYRETVAENLVRVGEVVRSEWKNRLKGGEHETVEEFLFRTNRAYDAVIVIYDRNGNGLGKALNGDKERFNDLLAQLGDKEKAYFERENEFDYGAYVEEGGGYYILAFKPVEARGLINKQSTVRTVLIGAFVVVASFIASGTLAGFLSRPLTEITEKAKQLASGDFSVDFTTDSPVAETNALAETLNHARDELSKTDRMQKELIANVSHDFKTPLTMIKAYASMIREISGNNPEKRDKHAKVIIDEADRLANLVNDVLDLSKITSGIAELKKETFDLSAFTKETLDKFGYLTETQGYRFSSEIEEEIVTFADISKIGQVLYNLIGNAVNYTGEDKKVSVVLKRIGGNKAIFSVTDTGKGIPEKEIPTIWERYYRSQDNHKRPVAGTGLGLSIVRAVLVVHGFSYGVKSREGKGSTFYILFPTV